MENPTQKVPYVRQVIFNRDRVASFNKYPFNLPPVRAFDRLALHPAVTFIIGENGSGKSTILEAIAIEWGFNPEGGSKAFGFSTRPSHSELHDYLTLVKGPYPPKDGFFLRAESFFNVSTAVDMNGAFNAYGGRSLHEQSQGEAFIALLVHRFKGNGLYILDEPEAALSPQRQLALLHRLDQLVKRQSQFIIATHSPIILSYPNARIIEVSSKGLQEVVYKETDHYRTTRDFLNNYQRTLKLLMEGVD